MRFTTPIVFALCAVASFFSDTCAAPVQPIVQLVSRDVFDPPITHPKGGETFHAGETIHVKWDTSGLPANLTNIGMIVLAKPTANSENLFLNDPLAQNFLLTEGHQKITFPNDLPTGDNYAIVLFGDSGNISQEFTIKASKYSDY